MRLFTISAISAACAMAQSFLPSIPQVRLVGDIPPLSNATYSNTTGCGLCVRQGNVFCQQPQLNRGYVCCGLGDWGCIQDAQNKLLHCATSDPANSSSSYYFNHDSMLWFQWCTDRPNNTAPNGCGCGTPSPTGKAACELSGNLSDTEWQGLTLDQKQMGYGGSCMYRVRTECGYPKITTTGSEGDIDVIYAYNKTFWTSQKTGQDSGWDFIERVEPNDYWMLRQSAKTDGPYNNTGHVS